MKLPQKNNINKINCNLTMIFVRNRITKNTYTISEQINIFNSLLKYIL